MTEDQFRNMRPGSIARCGNGFFFILSGLRAKGTNYEHFDCLTCDVKHHKGHRAKVAGLYYESDIKKVRGIPASFLLAVKCRRDRTKEQERLLKSKGI